MSEPVDVQAERLREHAEASRRFGEDAERGSREWSCLPWQDHLADFVVSDEDAAFIAACDPQTVLSLLDLLAGQAEQIEALTRERDDLRERKDAWLDKWLVATEPDAGGDDLTDLVATVRDRLNSGLEADRPAIEALAKLAQELKLQTTLVVVKETSRRMYRQERDAAVRQRDNLRDAAQRVTCKACGYRIDTSSGNPDEPEECPVCRPVREALRAAAVGEGGPVRSEGTTE